MGDGTEQSPYTRDDVLRLIKENGGTAKGLDLSEKWFERKIGLNKLDLEGVILDGAHLEEARLIGAKLKGAFLDGAHLEGANLSGAHLNDANLVSVHLEKAGLVRAHLEGAEFFDAHFEEADLLNTFLDRTRLSGAHLHSVHMFGAKFSANTEMGAVDWGNYILGEEKDGEKKGERHKLKWASDTYRRLKQWYTTAGVYDIAAKFYYREKEANRKQTQAELATQFKPKKAWVLLWLWIDRLLCGYGEKTFRVIISALVIIFGLTIAYYFWGSFDKSSFLDTLYYSVVSFVALGYGNWAPQPAGWAKGMGAAEAVIGVFMMALFLVTFVRKMTR